MIVDVAAPPSWITLIREHNETWGLPSVLCEETMVKRRDSRYTVVGRSLYKRSLPTSLLKCLRKELAYVLLEVHKWIVRKHLGVRVFAKKMLRAWYFLTSMVHDALEYVKKCDQCQ